MTKTEELLALAEAATKRQTLVSGVSQEMMAFSWAANPETIKQLVELARLMKRAIRIEHDDHCNCADHILEAIEAFNNFERNH